ncbi:MAG TPA: pilus assembly protein PilM [Dongiaceae bacterium]
MSARQTGWIGVDVGTHAVKLAQVARQGGEVRLCGAAVIQRPESWSADSALALDQPATSRLEIRAARECGEFSGRNAVCLLPMNVCQMRSLGVPPGSDVERRTMIEDELAAEWSEQRVAMEFDYWELESGFSDKASDGFNVNVMAVSRPWVGQLVSDCRHAGLDCWAIDGGPLAMARAVALAGAAGGRRTLAVDWGYSNTTLCVVGEGRPWYTRRAGDCAYGAALEAIAGEFGVTLDQAQHLADAHGITNPTDHSPEYQAMQAGLTTAVRAALDCLTAQIHRTLQFLEVQRRQLHPEAIWLMGGGASLRNLGRRLAHEFGLPVHVWKLPCENSSPPCVAGDRAAIFAGAAALSALAWRDS